MLQDAINAQLKLKTFVDSITGDLEKLVEQRKIIRCSNGVTESNIDSIDDLEKYTPEQIFYYIEALKIQIAKYGHIIQYDLGEIKRLYEVTDMLDAQQIIKHWDLFNKHLDENPTLKEEWEGLMMAIKLTEVFD